MMALNEKFVEKSLCAALSAIEIYNKPDFRYREETFSILMTNAWELLLKAKALKDNNDKPESLYAYTNDGKVKINRSGNPLTIELRGLMKTGNLDDVVQENLDRLIEIRDSAIHFIEDETLAYVVYCLGSANLKNYNKLMDHWFNRNLKQYNLYILPLAFAYSFHTLTALDLDKKPECISRFLRSVAETQKSFSDKKEFHFVCEIATKMVSAKKIIGDADIVAAIDPNAETVIVEKVLAPIDKYKFSYQELWEKAKEAKGEIKQTDFVSILKENQIKSDKRYAYYNFRTHLQKTKYEKSGILPKGITSIYNEDALRFIIQKIDEKKA